VSKVSLQSSITNLILVDDYSEFLSSSYADGHIYMLFLIEPNLFKEAFELCKPYDSTDLLENMSHRALL
jgi:hypothetical protein